jgi:spore coat polysaccharide biosynthesis protein SpsF
MYNGNKIIAIFQVRIGSTRLPGKVLIEIENKTLLQHVIDRVKRSNYIDEIILATTTNPQDRQIVEYAQNHNFQYFRGNEEDVLDRFYQCAKTFSAGVIVRITPDDPFKDPGVIDQAIKVFCDADGALDYVSNTIIPTYPIGLDIEVFSFAALEKAWIEGKKPSEREHVTPYIWNHPELFRIKNFTYATDLSDNHWTLDTEKDLLFTKEVYSRLYRKNPFFTMMDILSVLQKEPELRKINSCDEKFSGYLKSLEKDKFYEVIK